MFEAVVKSAQTFGKSIALSAKRKSPELFMVAGTAGFIATGVTIAIQSRKVDAILDEHEARLEKIKELKRKSEEAGESEEQQKEIGKATAMAWAKFAGQCARLYALPLALGGATLFCFFKANGILKGLAIESAAMAAAANADLKKYRDGVVETFGKEVDKDIRLGVKEEEVEKEDGTTEKVKLASRNHESIYVKYFTKSNPYWDNDPRNIQYFFECQQSAANNILRGRGRKGLTLNEVYTMLGFETTPAGMVCGWIFDKANPTGDNKVLFDITRVKIRNENGSIEEAYAVDFNVDGNIYNTMVQDLRRSSRAS